MVGIVKRFLRYWKRKPSQQDARLRIAVRDQTRITLSEWQSRPDLVKIGSKFLDDPQFRLMLDVLRTTHFLNAMLPITGVSVEDRAAMQARSEGYTICLNNLEALGIFRQPKAETEETYEPEEKTEDELEQTT